MSSPDHETSENGDGSGFSAEYIKAVQNFKKARFSLISAMDAVVRNLPSSVAHMVRAAHLLMVDQAQDTMTSIVRVDGKGASPDYRGFSARHIDRRDMPLQDSGMMTFESREATIVTGHSRIRADDYWVGVKLDIDGDPGFIFQLVLSAPEFKNPVAPKFRDAFKDSLLDLKTKNKIRTHAEDLVEHHQEMMKTYMPVMPPDPTEILLMRCERDNGSDRERPLLKEFVSAAASSEGGNPKAVTTCHGVGGFRIAHKGPGGSGNGKDTVDIAFPCSGMGSAAKRAYLRGKIIPAALALLESDDRKPPGAENPVRIKILPARYDPAAKRVSTEQDPDSFTAQTHDNTDAAPVNTMSADATQARGGMIYLDKTLTVEPERKSSPLPLQVIPVDFKVRAKPERDASRDAGSKGRDRPAGGDSPGPDPS